MLLLVLFRLLSSGLGKQVGNRIGAVPDSAGTELLA